MNPNSLTASLIFVGKIIIAAAIALFFIVWFTRAGPLGGNFTLTDSDGRQVTQADLRAKPSAVFFGYTHCPDFCPTTLADLQGWLAQLSPQQRQAINVWFITVDPERDTPQLLHDYLASISEGIAPGRILGISGRPAAVREVIKAFNIAAQKVPGEDGEYTYDHTSAIILLNKGGRRRGTIPYQEKPDIAVKQLKALADSA